MWNKLRNYISNIDSHFPSYYGRSCVNSLKAFAYYVFSKHGEVSSKAAKELFEKEGINRFSMESLGWLLYCFSFDLLSCKEQIDLIMDHLKNKVNETAETANFVTSYDDDGNFNYFIF